VIIQGYFAAQRKPRDAVEKRKRCSGRVTCLSISSAVMPPDYGDR
jgi:hypothetical protein